MPIPINSGDSAKIYSKTSTKSLGRLNNPIKYNGSWNGNLLEQPDFSYTNNGRGLLEGTAKFKWSHSNDMRAQIPPVARMDSHPNNGNLWCWDVSTTFGKNGVATTDAKYVGLESGKTMTDPEWHLSNSVGEQSIRFHPKFSDWVNQAAGDRMKIRLDEQGYFVSFGPNHPEVPAVEQFVSPAGQLSMSFFTNTKSNWQKLSYDQIAKQYIVPPFTNSKFADELNVSRYNLSWLLTGCNVTEYAKIYKVESEFILSVLNKPHNIYMYPSGQ